MNIYFTIKANEVLYKNTKEKLYKFKVVLTVHRH